MRALALLLLVSACDERVGADPARIFLLDRLRVDLAEATQAAAAHASPIYPCTAIVATVASFAKEWERLAPATRKELEQARTTCNTSALAFGDQQVAKLAQARQKHTEAEDAVQVCFELERVVELTTGATPNDPKVQALAAKKKALCP